MMKIYKIDEVEVKKLNFFHQKKDLLDILALKIVKFSFLLCSSFNNVWPNF